MLRTIWNIKLIRFLCVGMFNTALDFTLLNILVLFAHLPVLLANGISVCVGVTVSYFLNHKIVFRRKDPYELKVYLKFFAITGVSVLIIQSLVIVLMTPIYNSLYEVLASSLHSRSIVQYEASLTLNTAKATAVLVGMVWNYVLYSKIVFNKPSKDRLDPEDVLE